MAAGGLGFAGQSTPHHTPTFYERGDHEPMRCFLMALVMLLASQAQAHDWRESPAVGELFQRAGMKGTFVLYDVAARTYRGHDETRANQRFVPASTFKIPNSLIGLTVGAVAGPDEVLPYRGIPTPSSRSGRGT